MKLFGTMGKTLSLVAFVAILAGCSSDSDDAVAPVEDDATASSGVFMDSVVQGLDYNCSTSGFTGTTDVNGKFNYEIGDSCTFSYGEVTLGTAKAKDVVTPLDLITGVSGDELSNLLRFLQSLDSDGDLSNGITLPDDEGFYGGLDFTLPSESFATALGLFQLENELPIVDVEEQAALDHFYTSTDPYFQTTLTEVMLNDKMATFEGGSQLIVKSDATYQLMLVDGAMAEVCTGSWNIDATKLMLTQVQCGGFDDPDAIELDFMAEPATGVNFRVKSGASEPYNYSFIKIESMGDAVAPAAPMVVENTTFPATSSSLAVGWNKVPTATSYTLIYNKTGDFSGLNLLNFYDVNTFGALFAALDEETTYYFQMRATNAAGISVASNIYSATTLAVPTAPAAPTSLVGKATSFSTSLGWSDNSDNEDEFYIQASDGERFLKTDNITSMTVSADETSWSGSSIPSGNTIYFRVKATNSVGSSAYSNVVTLSQ